MLVSFGKFRLLKVVLHKVAVMLETVCRVQFYAHIRGCYMYSSTTIGSCLFNDSVKKFFLQYPSFYNVGRCTYLTVAPIFQSDK